MHLTLLSLALAVVEKDPALAEKLLGTLLTLLANNPALLEKVVGVGLAAAEKALAVPPASVSGA